MKEGPTADTYTGASGSQTLMDCAADTVPPSPCGSGAKSPDPGSSKFARMEYRPPTPPLEPDSAEPSELNEQAEEDQEPDIFLPCAWESSSESLPESLAREDQLARASSAGYAAETGHEELPPPYSPAQLGRTSGDGEGEEPLAESALPVTASPQPPADASHESSGASQQQPTQTSSPITHNPPLHIITTPRKGRGISASRPISRGEILVRENPLLNERHDRIPGGRRRIRES